MIEQNDRPASAMTMVIANTFAQRAIGLLGRLKQPRHECMYFPNTRSVHTFGMLFSIDVIYLNEHGVIVAIHPSLKPFRVSWCQSAQNLCELAQGMAAELRLKKGQIWPLALYR
jgi:uncharacterized protein